jgi:hypothetical protein
MTVLIPRHLVQPTAPKAPPVTIGVFLTFEHLGGRQATTADLMPELVKLKQSDVIRWLAVTVSLA